MKKFLLDTNTNQTYQFDGRNLSPKKVYFAAVIDQDFFRSYSQYVRAIHRLYVYPLRLRLQIFLMPDAAKEPCGK